MADTVSAIKRRAARMASKTAGKVAVPSQAESVENEEDLISTTPDGWEFETVAEESPTKVIFDTIGDVFIGQYVGQVHVDQEPDDKGVDQSFDLFTFRGRDQALYAINSSFKMVQAAALIQVNDWVRITYIKDLPSKKGNPAKDLRIEIRKSTATE